MKDIDNGHKVRIKDIAIKAGCSVGTVDRVLHNRGEVSPKTRKKVLEVIKALDYKPNRLASVLASQRIFKIGVLIPDQSAENLYWEQPLIGINQAGNEIKDYGISLSVKLFKSQDIRSFRKQSQILLSEELTAVLLAPVFYQESLRFMARCKEMSIAVALIDTQINEVEPISYIGQNSCQGGLVAARLLSTGVIDDPRFIIFNIARELDQMYHFNEREKGFRTFLSSHKPATKIDSFSIHGQNTNEIKAIFTSLINQKKLPDGIFVTGSKVHRVAEVLKELDLTDIRLIGFDLLEPNIRFLNEEIIDFLISQQPEEQGYLGIMSLFNHLVLKKDVPVTQFMPINIVVKENMTDYPVCK